MGLDELIAAKRTYGRVDEHDGEYVETEFTCLGWLRIPLVPERSFWIADDRGSKRLGFQIKLHPRSVAATYLRIWVPGIAIAVLVLWSSSLATAIAATLFALSAWSWTWWPRDAAVRRRSDFDLAAFGSRCDPARMTDKRHQFLANQLTLRASAHADPRPPDDVVRFGARTVDEALLAYGFLRLTDARSPRPRRSPNRFHEAEWMIGSAVRRLRPRGGPYRDRSAANTLELWATISASAQASANDRRADPLRSHGAVPAPALVLPSFVRKPWIWFAVLAVSTAVAGVARSGDSTSQPARQQALPQPPAPQPARQQALPQPPAPQQPRAAPRLRSGDELARSPMGEYIAVECDYVQNSDHGSLRRVTLCVVGRHILAVAGGNRLHDNGRLLQGYVEAIPGAQVPSWASALRTQIQEDPRYYDFYLRRISYGDDPPDDAEEKPDHRDDDPWFAARSDPRGEQRAGGGNMGEALIRALAVAAILAILAGWFVWIRLWQLRRRVATWIVTG